MYYPPLYSAVNFVAVGGTYSGPAYNAVNFSVPTSDVAAFTVLSGSSLTAIAGFTATFSGSTSFVPETAERPFAAAAWSSFTAITDQRDFNISGASSFIGRYGAIMYCSGASSFSPWLELPMYAQFACPTASLLSASGASFIDSYYTSVGRSRLYPGRGYIKGLQFSAKGKSKGAFVSNFTRRYESAMYCSGSSNFYPHADPPVQAKFTCRTLSSILPHGASSVAAAYSSIGRSRLYPGRGYIQGLVFSGKSKSEATFASGAILSAAFSGQSVGGGAFKGTGVQSRAFSSGGESSLLPAYTKIVSSVFSGASDTLLSGHGVTAKVADMVSYSYSSSDFRTSFSYVAIPEPLDDPIIVFSRTSTQKIMVRTA